MVWLKQILQFLHRSDGSLQQKVLRSGFWVGLSSVIGSGLSFLRSIVLARLLMPEAFGVMAICSMVIRGMEIFTETGFGAALIHRQQRFEDARDTAFTLWVLRGTVLSLVAFLVAPWIAEFYNEEVLASVISVVGICFFLSGLTNVNTIALQKELDFKRLTQFEQMGAVLTTVIAIGLAYVLRNVWALVYAQLAGTVISVGLSYLLVPGRPRLRFDPVIAKELFSYGKFMTGLAIVVFAANQMDNAIIGKLLGMEALGYYSVAYTLANVLSTDLSKMVARVFFPLFSKLQADPGQLRREYARGIGLIAAIVVPISVVTMVLAEEIIAVLYGAKWAAAVAPLQILAAFGCFHALWMLNGYLCNAIGKPQVDFYMNGLRFVMVLGLLYPLTRAYGLWGASLAVAIPMAGQCLAGIYLARLVIGAPVSVTFRPVGIALAQSAGIAALLFFAKSVINSNSMAGLVALIVLGGIACVLLNVRTLKAVLANRDLKASTGS